MAEEDVPAIRAYLEKQKDAVPNGKYIQDIADAFEDGRRKGEQKPVEWSEEDEEMLDILLTMVDCSTVVPHSGGQLHPSENYKKDISTWLKAFRPSWKPNEQEKGALRTAISILTEERNFPKAAAQLQNILDAFEGKEPRKDWKPSKAQITALKVVARGFPADDPEAIDSLLNDLQKLV